MAGGLAILLFSSVIGALLDRFNAKTISIIGSIITVLGLALLPLTTTPIPTTLIWCTVILGAQTCIISLNKQILTMPGSDSLVSITLALRFFGNAFSPVIILPFFLMSPATGFWLCAIITLLGLAGLLVRKPPEIRTNS